MNMKRSITDYRKRMLEAKEMKEESIKVYDNYMKAKSKF